MNGLARGNGLGRGRGNELGHGCEIGSGVRTFAWRGNRRDGMVRGRGIVSGVRTFFWSGDGWRCAASLMCALAVVLLTACEAPEGMRPLAVGDAAPAYAAPRVDGDSVAIGDLDGAVLLNIWATWCVPCREEMPALDSLHRAFKAEGLHVVGANIDNGDASSAVREFAREHNIGFDLLLDPQQRVVRTFRTAGVPETFLIDRNGRVAGRWIGQFDPLSERVTAAVASALLAEN